MRGCFADDPSDSITWTIPLTEIMIMTEFSITTVDAQPYLYVERKSSMEPDEVGPAVGSGLQEVYAHMQGNGVPPAGSALVLYTSNADGVMDYNVGFEISPEDMDKEHDQIKAGKTPAGKVLTHLHVGPYTNLRETYGAMMQHMESESLQWAGPCWEVYLNDPSSTAEADLKTRIYISIA